jgi:ribosome maturation factor RimP
MHIGLKQAENIRHLADRQLEGSPFFVLAVHVTPGQSARIKVVVDGDHGVTIDDCAKISRELNQAMSGSEFPVNYNLEVTTPGVDQPLKSARQFPKHVGRNLKVVLKKEGKILKGKLTAATSEGITLLTESEKGKKHVVEAPLTLNFEEIEKTIVQISFK